VTRVSVVVEAANLLVFGFLSDPVRFGDTRLRHNEVSAQGKSDFPVEKGSLVDNVLANTPLFSALVRREPKLFALP